uniref:helix-turn-helix domain-containing protein n=1 Tax=Microbacterium aurum TaxID=36805 RepID=UPI0028E79051
MHRHDELTAWALRVPVVGTRQIGEASTKLVLIALCQYANADRAAWPSAQTLADDLGSTRRDVRNALAALEAAGLIAAVAGGRSKRWQILAPGPESISPTWRDTPSAEQGGDASDLAGYPA